MSTVVKIDTKWYQNLKNILHLSRVLEGTGTYLGRVLYGEGVPDAIRGRIDPAEIVAGILPLDVRKPEALVLLVDSVVERVLGGGIWLCFELWFCLWILSFSVYWGEESGYVLSSGSACGFCR